MPPRLTRGDKWFLLPISILILIFIVISCIGAQWCRSNYYCPDAHTNQYTNDCTANSLAVFFKIVACWFEALREDINALATAILAFFTVVLAYATRRQANLTR